MNIGNSVMQSAGDAGVISGVIRRRRNFSKILSFLTLELQGGDRLCTDGYPLCSFQIVCDGWEVCREAVAGILVEVAGVYEYSPNGVFRMLASPDGLTILPSTEPRIEGWRQASVHAEWRSRSASQVCACSDLLCNRWHNDPDRWIEGKRLRKEAKALVAIENEIHPAEAPEAKAKHNFVFSTWLVDTFPASVLAAGVVEIAGGRGLVSMKLAMEHDIPVTLIEPKELKINKTYRRRLKKYWRKRKQVAESILVAPMLQDGIVSDADMLNSTIDITKEDSCPETGVEYKIDLPFVHLREEFYGITDASLAARSAVVTSGILLAMHPDSATGAVVEAAISLRRPFAVVPCCVFAYMFLERKTPGGKVVSTYDELLNYLENLCKENGGSVFRHNLPFEGRNTVLYCMSYD